MADSNGRLLVVPCLGLVAVLSIGLLPTLRGRGRRGGGVAAAASLQTAVRRLQREQEAGAEAVLQGLERQKRQLHAVSALLDDVPSPRTRPELEQEPAQVPATPPPAAPRTAEPAALPTPPPPAPPPPALPPQEWTAAQKALGFEFRSKCRPPSGAEAKRRISAMQAEPPRCCHGSPLQPSDRAVVFLSDDWQHRRTLATASAVRSRGGYRGMIVFVDAGPQQNDWGAGLAAVEPYEMVSAETLWRPVPERLRQPPPVSCSARANPHRAKGWRAYYYKLLFFSSYFRRWKHLFWIDSGMQVGGPVPALLDAVSCQVCGKMVAHSDAYPAWVWSFGMHNAACDSAKARELTELGFPIANGGDYFQSTFMAYDSAIITNTTLTELAAVYSRYAVLAEHDQPMLGLYWIYHRCLWEQVTTRTRDRQLQTYDYYARTHFLSGMQPGLRRLGGAPVLYKCCGSY